MKRFVCVLMAVLMLASLVAVPAEAKGYTLSIPSTVSPHNLNSFGLRTLNVYRAETAPVIDGKVKEAIDFDEEGNPIEWAYEYPGPNGGMVDSVYVGDGSDGQFTHGLWISSCSPGNKNGFGGSQDFTGYVAEQDLPSNVDTYMTYDDNYLYFAVVYNHIPQQKSAFLFDTRVNFMQSENMVDVAASVAWTRYSIGTSATAHTPSNAYVYAASGSTKSGRQIRQILDGKDITHYVDYYVDSRGTAWGSVGSSPSAAPYYRAENTYYNIEVLDDTFEDETGATRNYWNLTIEGRQPLGDILRITDVEYEDGSAIDYVPEWGVWGTDLKMFSTATVEGTAPNGSDVVVTYNQPIFLCTFLPAGGTAYTGTNSRVSGFVFNNTVSAAVNTSFLGTVSQLLNPVHFLGDYVGFDADSFYGSGVGSSSSIATSSTRATRRKNPTLTEFDANRARVIGVATRASSGTGDNIMVLIALVSVMALSAVGAVSMLLIKRRKNSDK